MLLMIDNYDSFTYNLVQYLGELGEEVRVYRNDQITSPTRSPSCNPATHRPLARSLHPQRSRRVAGRRSSDFAGRFPILGVCLGHQSIGQAFGGHIVRAGQVMHGKTSAVYHHWPGRIRRPAQPVYRGALSFAGDRAQATAPDCLEITAWTRPGRRREIMGVRHKTLPVEGVQFHPESILTEHGHALLRNFLDPALNRPGERSMSITPQEALQRTIEHREIFYDEMLSLMRQIMAGEISPVMTAAILTGLRVKKETIGEITAAATVMRELSTKVHVPPPHEHFVDIVGTGGDGAHTFNISTASDVRRRRGRRARRQARQSRRVVQIRQRRRAGSAGRPHRPHAGTGGRVHRNHRHRLHVRAQPSFGDEKRRPGAPRDGRAHHLQHPRPADQSGRRARISCMGVFHPDLVGIQVRVLQRLGAQHVLVVWGKDGMDEISLGAATLVGELKNGEITEYEIHPEDFGLAMVSNRGLKVENAEQSKTMVLAALDNDRARRATSSPSTPARRCTRPTSALHRRRHLAGAGSPGQRRGAGQAGRVRALHPEIGLMSDTPDILQKILARKVEEIAERSAQLSLPELRRRVENLPPPRPFPGAVWNKPLPRAGRR